MRHHRFVFPTSSASPICLTAYRVWVCLHPTSHVHPVSRYVYYVRTYRLGLGTKRLTWGSVHHEYVLIKADQDRADQGKSEQRIVEEKSHLDIHSRETKREPSEHPLPIQESPWLSPA